MIGFFSFLFILALTTNAWSKDLCQMYAGYAPLPSWYSDLCGKGGEQNLRSAVGGAFSSFADSFNLNSASLPTVNLPVGVEAIASWPTTSTTGQTFKGNFTIIKGLNGAGFGMSTDNNNSIYSNRSNHGSTSSTKNSAPANATSNSPSTAIPTISLGSALSIHRLLQLPELKLPQIGFLMRYNNDLKNWSPGVGASYQFWRLSLGASMISEQDPYADKITVITESIGIKVAKIQIEFIYIQNSFNSGNVAISESSSLITASGGFSRLLFNGALRFSGSSRNSSTKIYHLGVQYGVTPKVSLSYLYNYIPGYSSLGAQVFF